MANFWKGFFTAFKKVKFLVLGVLLFLFIFTFGRTVDQSQSVAGDNEVYIKVGDNINQIFSNNRSGNTTFIFQTGVHRLSEVLYPRSGDVLIGEYGAIITGAKDLNSSEFKKDGTKWYIAAQTQETAPYPSGYRGSVGGGSGTGYACKPEFPRCTYNEELFIDDSRIDHVESLSKVTAGKWFFDYTNDRIYIGDDPTNKKIETSVTDYAINVYGDRTGITIQNLVFEKFATKLQRSVIELASSGNVIENVTVQNSHGSGIRIGDSGLAKFNYVYANGQSGFGGDGKNMIFEFNEIAYNSAIGLEYTWDGGGSKWVKTENLIVRNNYSHHNDGPGFWTDIDNKNSLYENNIVVYNNKHGIQHEISFDAVIRNNFVAYNASPGFSHGNQIFVQNSKNVEVYDNIAIVDSNFGGGIVAQSDNRGYSSKFSGEAWNVRNVNVYNNQIYHNRTNAGIISGLRGISNSGDFNVNDAKSSVKFTNNKYNTKVPTNSIWEWGSYVTKKNYDGFKQQGQDTNSTVQTNFTVPEIPTWNYTVGPIKLSQTEEVVCGNNICESTEDINVCAADCSSSSQPYKNEVGVDYFVLEMENFDTGGNNVSYFDTTLGNNYNGYRPAESVDIKDKGNGSYVVGLMATGEWLKYTINVPQSGEYKLISNGASLFADNKFAVKVGGNIKKSISLPTTTSWEQLKVSDLGTLNLDRGVQTIEIFVEKQWLDLDYLRFEFAGDICGDGVVDSSEVCDDGNILDNDQCSSTCQNLCGFNQVWDGNACTNSYKNEVGEDYLVIQAENYDQGGAGVGYKDLDSQNRGGSNYRSADQVDIKDGSTGQVVGFMQTGEWLKYTINVPQTGEYTLKTFAATTQSDATIAIYNGGNLLKNVVLNNTGSFTAFKEQNAGIVTLNEGANLFEIRVEKQYLDLDYIKFEKTLDPVCGNNIIETGETCDDGNTSNNDVCSNDCRNICDTGYVWNGSLCVQQFRTLVNSDLVLIEAENYNLGGQNVGYFDKSTGNTGGTLRNDDVDIKDTGDNNYVVGWMETGEWLEYKFDVEVAGEYKIITKAGTNQNDAQLKFSTTTGVNETLNIKNTNGYGNLSEQEHQVISLTSGDTTVRITVGKQFLDLDFIKLERVIVANPVCGNGVLENDEQCDDNNLIDGDGCDSLCRNEEVSNESIACGAIDSNNDLRLDIVDLIGFVEAFNKTCNDTPQPSVSATTCGGKDSNSDGIINIVDLVYFITLFNGASCTV